LLFCSAPVAIIFIPHFGHGGLSVSFGMGVWYPTHHEHGTRTTTED
jgi:hypothetical protein